MGARAGAAVARYPEPLDLCLGCLECFGDWLKSGRIMAQDDLGAIPRGCATP